MSSSRANASAVNRRTNGPGPAPVKQANNSKQPDYRQLQKQQTPINKYDSNNYDSNASESNKPPKLSLQQAIGLTSLRLSRVETFLETLPDFENLHFETQQQQQQQNELSIPENMRVVDEAIFNNLVSRLEKVEQTNLLTQKQNELNIKKLQTNFSNLTKTVENIRLDFISLKDNFQNLQEFVIETTTKSDENTEEVEENNTSDIENENNSKTFFIEKENDTKEDSNEPNEHNENNESIESNEIITTDLKQTIENEINASI